jgi:replicative DNA helicase
MIDSVSDSAGAPLADLKAARRRKATALAAAPQGGVDRLPPHSHEAEQGVLGCVLLAPNDCLGDCITKFKTGGEVFYDLRHQTIYTTLAEMHDD